VVMLACVDEIDGEGIGGSVAYCPVDRSDLHVVWPRPSNEENLRPHVTATGSLDAREARIAEVARIPATTSRKGIGSGAPVRTASTVACSSARCPLSRPHVR